MSTSLKIIIIGAGTMGSHISDLLQQEKHRVVVVDRSAENLKKLADTLDVQTLQGHGADPYILRKAGVSEAELVLAITNIDEVNLLAAFTAKQLGAKKCVARARSSWCVDTRRINLRSALGIDRILNPEHLTALEIVRYLDNPDALALARFAFGKVQLITFTLDEKSKFAGRALRDCKLPRKVLVAVKAKGNEVMIPNGETVLEAGDKLTIMGVAEDLPEAQRLFHAPSPRVQNVVIAGGGVTGLFLAETLEKRSFHVRIIEADRDRCEQISESLERTEVIYGDATNINFMKEERISTADVFIGVTGDDENNLMSCLLAKELGVDKTVVKLARPDYASLVQKFGVSLALSPRHVMAERILTLISRGRIQALTLLEDGRVEVIEFTAEHGSPMVGKPLSSLTLPEGTLISTIVHLGETIIPRGDDQIEPGDTVIAVGLREAMDQLEASFSRK